MPFLEHNLYDFIVSGTFTHPKLSHPGEFRLCIVAANDQQARVFVLHDLQAGGFQNVTIQSSEISRWVSQEFI